VEKKCGVGYGNVSLIAGFFNLFNASTVVRIKDLRLDSPNYLLPAELLKPRQLRLGLQCTF